MGTMLTLFGPGAAVVGSEVMLGRFVARSLLRNPKIVTSAVVAQSLVAVVVALVVVDKHGHR